MRTVAVIGVAFGAGLVVLACSSSGDLAPATASSPDASPVGESPPILEAGSAATDAQVDVIADAGSDADAADAYDGRDEECGAFAKAFCDQAFACASAYARYAYGVLAQCELSATRDCQQRALLPGMAKMTAPCFPDKNDCSTFPAAIPVPGCGIGTRANGVTCELDEQCASGSCSYRNLTTTYCATCQPSIYTLGVGESCDTSAAYCQRGLMCNAALRCVKAVPKGGACIGGECRDQWTSCQDGICKDDLPAGAACNPLSFIRCNFGAGLECYRGTCAPIVIAATGEPCGDIGERHVYCDGGDECLGAIGEERCFRRGDVGQWCGGGGACLSAETCSGPGTTCEFTPTDRCK